MKLKCTIFVLCCLALVGKIKAIGSSVGPLGKIIIDALYDCKGDLKPKGDEVKAKLTLRKINNDVKVLDVEYESKIDLDDSNMDYHIEFKRLESGTWKSFYSVKGKPCNDFNRYIKKIWNKLTSALVPKLEKSCPIPAGSYIAKGFLALTQDLEIKSVFYGKLMVTISVRDKNGKVLYCSMAEGESKAPY